MYSVTLSNLPWSARMIHIKIWSLRILKNTFCPLWELDGNQIMTSLGACSTFSCWPGTTWVLLCGWPLGSVPAAATLVMLGFPGHLRFFLEAVTSQRLGYQDGRFSSKKQQQDGWSSSANCWQKTSEWPSIHPASINYWLWIKLFSNFTVVNYSALTTLTIVLLTLKSAPPSPLTAPLWPPPASPLSGCSEVPAVAREPSATRLLPSENTEQKTQNKRQRS